MKEIIKMEKLEEEIRIFKKNENAYYDMLALYYSLLNLDFISNSILYTLVEKLICDLEDKEVSVKLKDYNSVFEIFEFIDEKYYEIKEKYKDIDECKKLCDNFCLSSRNKIIYEDFKGYYYKEGSSFDLIKLLAEKNMYSIIEKFLVSNISLDDKTNILSNFIIHNSKNGNVVNSLCKLLIRINKFEIKEVIDSYVYKELINNIIDNEEYNYIPHLQKSFDLNSKQYSYTIMQDDKSINVSLVGLVGNLDQSIVNIKELYENDSYINLPDEIRANNDLVILENIDPFCIEEFIKLTHFEVTDKNIDILSNIVISLYIDEKTIKLVEKYLNKYSLAILHKAKNKSEYKEMLKYVKKLEEKVKLGIYKLEKEEKEEKDKSVYRSLFTVILKEIEKKTEENLSNLNVKSPKKLKNALTVEDLKVNKK